MLSLCVATPIFAQTNIGIDYYLLGEYGNARKFFESQLSSKPAESNFYLGEIAFAEGNMAKAAEFYNKCATSDPGNPLCLIGQAKLKLKSDPKAAESALDAVARSNKSNLDVALAIGRAYLDNKMMDKALEKVADAKKINSKAPEIYILEGDIIAAGGAGKTGEAAGKYEMSNYYAPDYGLGYMKTAQLYEFVNPDIAIEKMQAVIKKHPDYAPAYGLMAKIFTHKGFYPQAIEIYKTHAPSTPDDIERYARALYFTDNLDEAQKMIDKGLREDPNNFVMTRYQLYVYAKKGNYTDGIKLAENFLALGDKSRYIPMDYAAYAILLKDAKRYDEAIAQFNLAISMDPDSPEHYKGVYEMAKEMENFGMAAEYYKTYIDKKVLASDGSGYGDELVDINILGYEYFTAGTSIAKNPVLAGELMKNSALIKELLASGNGFDADLLANNLDYFTAAYSKYYLTKASAVFSTLIERAPESYSGYRFKALSENALDPDMINSTVARDNYEKMIEVITAKEGWETSASMQRMMLEGYGYLLIYYFKTDDSAKAIQYANKILELDPENGNAKAILEALSK